MEKPINIFIHKHFSDRNEDETDNTAQFTLANDISSN